MVELSNERIEKILHEETAKKEEIGSDSSEYLHQIYVSVREILCRHRCAER